MKLKQLFLMVAMLVFSTSSAFDISSAYGEEELNIKLTLNSPILSFSENGVKNIYSDGFPLVEIGDCNKKMRRVENFYIPDNFEVQDIEVAAITEFISENGDIKYNINPFCNSSESEWVKKTIFLKDVELFRGMKVGSITINPFKYDEIKREILYCKKLDIKIKFQKVSEIDNVSCVNTRYLRELNDILSIPCRQFFEDLNNFNIEPFALQPLDLWDDAPVMIVVTPSEFLSEAQRYASVKMRLGYDIQILELPANTLRSTNKLYSAIKQKYDTGSSIDYVLLMGNGNIIASYAGNWPQVWDTSKYGDSDTRFYYSDFKYCCMDGSDDYIPDICVGRFPANTIDELKIMIDKSIQYECYPPLGHDEYFNTISLCSEFKGKENFSSVEESYFIYTSEFIKDNLLNYRYGFDSTVNCIYYSNPYVSPKMYNNLEMMPEYLRSEYDWNKTPLDFENVFNSGASVIGMRGHGHNSTWSYCGFKNYNAQNLSNKGLLPVVFGMSCLIGNFYNPWTLPSNTKCIATTMLQNPNGGAVGVFAPASDSYSGYNDILYANLFDAMYPGSMAFFYIPQIGGIPGHSESPYSIIGKIINRAKIRSFNSFDHSDDEGRDYYAYVTRETYNWLGDPSIQIYKSKPTRRKPYIDTYNDGMKLYDNRTLVAVNKLTNTTVLPHRTDGAYDLKKWYDRYDLSLVGEGYVPEILDLSNYLSSEMESKILSIKNTGYGFEVEYQTDAENVNISSYSIYGERLYSTSGKEGVATIPNLGSVNVIVLEADNIIADRKTVK